MFMACYRIISITNCTVNYVRESGGNDYQADVSDNEGEECGAVNCQAGR